MDASSTRTMKRRQGQYKKINMRDQNSRRKQVLERQKQARRDLTSFVRNLVSPSSSNNNGSIDVDGVEENTTAEIEMKDAAIRSDKRNDRLAQRREQYQNQLMVSEVR